jgi:soluble lytic murein transglycosylase-like protein
MQVMPRDGLASGFQCINGPCFANRPSMDELFDPAFNISYGTGYLAGLVLKNQNLRDALYAYGPAGVGYSYADHVIQVYRSAAPP